MVRERGADRLSRINSGTGADRVFDLVTAGAAWLVLLLMIGTAASMAWGGRLAFNTFGFHFLTSTACNPVTRDFVALLPIYGTLVTSLIAIVIAVPVSIGIALFLTEIAPRWTRGPIGIAIELFAAIPSIIYGMWGLFVFAPFMGAHVEPWLNDHLGPLPVIGGPFSGPPPRIGMLPAGVVSRGMIIPFIPPGDRGGFNSVPPPLKGSSGWLRSRH